MTTIVIVLTEGFAEWETTLLGAVAKGFYGVDVRYATPAGAMVTSNGGMKVIPDTALEEADVAALDALVVSGGTIWQSAEAPDLGDLLRAAKAAGKVIGLVCDATVAGARAGILDTVGHTSNGAGYLDSTGYAGGPLYRDVPHAVADQNVVTASASAPVSFMQEIMRAIGKGDDNLDDYVAMHAAQFARRPSAERLGPSASGPT
jgi:putative intracellular protease/amidase